LTNADNSPENWVTYGKNYAEDRFSSLTQINKETIGRLGLSWSLNLGTTRGIEATPLVMDGIMFLTGPWSKVFAVDARTEK
jgi:quinohemoprotein ethanol dehydrogenase